MNQYLPSPKTAIRVVGVRESATDNTYAGTASMPVTTPTDSRPARAIAAADPSVTANHQNTAARNAYGATQLTGEVSLATAHETPTAAATKPSPIATPSAYFLVDRVAISPRSGRPGWPREA